MKIYEYYKTLGLPPNASREDARHAYRKLVNRWHPDRFALDDALHQLAEEHLKLFNIAYAEVKKQIAARHRRHRSAFPSPPKRTGAVSPGRRKRGPTGSGGTPPFLNRLPRKFRQALISFFYAPPTPAPARKKSGAQPSTRASNLDGKDRIRPGTILRKNFDQIFREVAGPEAAKLKRLAALKKHGRIRKTPRQNTAPVTARLVSTITRTDHSARITPVSRVRRIRKIRKI